MSKKAENPRAVVGSNSGVDGSKITAYCERVERLEEEKKVLTTDIREIYIEAKGNGFDDKTIRKLVALRKKKKEDREEEEAILAIYRAAIGL
jgi:uncharacterized protein (UPF0335 family)